MHFPVDGDLPTRKILEQLRDLGYTGPITLEIEDRNFTEDLSSEEKIAILTRERAFIRESLQ
jgi:sugar phosphate isomerase/epimerase